MQRLARLAEINRREMSDFYRIAMEDYATEQEQKMGLAPLTKEEETKFLMAAEEPAPYRTRDT